MAFESEVNRASYAGNGATTVFSFPRYFNANADLVVMEVDDATGVETVKTITTHYTVTGAQDEDGGSVTMLTAPAADITLVIYADPNAIQEIDFEDNYQVPFSTLERGLDNVGTIARRLKELAERSVRLPDGFTGTFDARLPVNIADCADKMPVMNSTGDGFADVDDWVTGDDIADAQANAAAAAASAAAAVVSEDLAEDWANKIDGDVDGSEYSAKAYAIGGTGVTDTATKGAAKEWAIEVASTVDGTNYSAKEHAIGTQIRGLASGGSAKDWATYTSGTVDNAEYSAKYWAQQSAAAFATSLGRDVLFLTSADSPYTIQITDAGKVFACDCSSGAISITLPEIALLTLTSPWLVGVKKTDSSVNKVTIARASTDTIGSATSKLLEFQNQGCIMFPDTTPSPDVWTPFDTVLATVGGAGIEVELFTQADSAVESVVNDSQVYDFEDALSQYLYFNFRVPDAYSPGNQINFKGHFFTALTAGNAKFKTTATLIRVGTDANTSTTNQHASTNAAITVNAVSNVATAFVCDLTSSTGTINSVAVSVGDRIKVRIERDTATDTGAGSVYLFKKGYEVTLR